MGNAIGVKVPWVIPSQLIDYKAPIDPTEKDMQKNSEAYGIDAPDLTKKVGIDASSGTKTSGAYFLSNELAQDIPIPEDLQKKVRVMHEALNINPHNLHPSSRVANVLNLINEQLMIHFQFEFMIDKRKQDLEMINEKEEQFKQLVSAQTWNYKEIMMMQY